MLNINDLGLMIRVTFKLSVGEDSTARGSLNVEPSKEPYHSAYAPEYSERFEKSFRARLFERTCITLRCLFEPNNTFVARSYREIRALSH